MQREERRGPWGRVLSKSGVYGMGRKRPHRGTAGNGRESRVIHLKGERTQDGQGAKLEQNPGGTNPALGRT